MPSSSLRALSQDLDTAFLQNELDVEFVLSINLSLHDAAVFDPVLQPI